MATVRCCESCGNTFVPHNNATKHCSLSCRFWSKVDKGGGVACWIWTAAKSSDGYGSFDQAGAHRMAWELARGPIPRGLSVLHNCPTGDNPACVNPDHLWLGTQPDNIADMTAKGRRRVAVGEANGQRKHPERTARGERNAGAKIGADVVAEIRKANANGESYSRIVERFGVSKSQVARIVRGQSWRHVA
jgi:hypothetical protein